MFFLLRMAFWLSVVLILLPSGSSQPAPASDVGAAAAISASSATVQDMRGFCSRQPEACTVGSQVAVSLGYRAQAGAKMVYDFLTDKLASRDDYSGSRTGAPATVNASEDTLTPADLAPAWHGPPSRKEAKHSA